MAGVAYEVLKGLAKFDNPFVRILKKPGLWFQKLTTREPDDSMLEVSLTAFKTVMAMDADESIPTIAFNVKKDYRLARREVIAALKDVEEAETIADWIFVHYLGTERSALPTLELIDEASAKAAVAAAERVKAGEPMQYVLGETDFYGVSLKTDERALIPRGDTEFLLEEAIKYVKPAARVLDLCTGSGAVAVLLALKTEGAVSASDISEDALALAAENAEKTGAQVTFLKSDLFENITGVYDVITANPPYIPTADCETLDPFVKREPRLALDGGEDGLDFYRRIAAELPAHWHEGSVLLMEIGAEQGAAVTEIFSALGSVTVKKDLEGHDRVVTVARNV